ncbi:SRPBCC domain-containing protein [uncultured Psychroserpens sp.]|uniref:SRPBCC family protein n=1 Tax=uncultured Psychroserpens sp. TaxID=255436 RepID=UPI00261CA74E|nr:SRPBCC domain-containing protein [uncultured Psychroserpens sp.]
MSDHNLDYKKTIEVSANANQLFNALTDEMHLWWGKISDSNFDTNGRFTVTFENNYWWTFKIVEFLPNREIIWKCIAGEPEFNKEWIGHVLHWQITEKNSKTTLQFHHVGLNPDINCYDVCSTTWDMFIIDRLKNHVNKQVVKN